jgi:hypothetical protein
MNGSVYILTNPAMPGIVKIGLTTREDINERLRELFTTSVPVPFDCAFACKVDDCNSVERALHIAFGPNRIHPQREFFKIEPEQAIVILKLLQKEDITPNINAEIDKNISTMDKEASVNLKKQRRPPLNFKEMGIPIGSKIEFSVSDEIIGAIVSSEKRITYNDIDYSLTKLTQELLGLDYAVQPTRYWNFQGKSLHEYYNETYSYED